MSQGLEHLLGEAFERARAVWPGLEVTREQFCRHVEERLKAAGRAQPAAHDLESLHLSDLYLACACALRVPGADEILEREIISRISSTLRRRRHTPERIDDVCQELREMLLQGRIATYNGEGKLASWIEVIAKRMANRKAGAGGKESSGLSGVVKVVTFPGDLEQDVVKRDLLRKFRVAVKEAVATLTPEQRELLSFHCGRDGREGLSEAKLAVLFNTSQPTISRRLKEARAVIFRETRRLLQQRLALTERDFESIIGDLQSRLLDVTLSQIFGPGKGGADRPGTP